MSTRNQSVKEGKAVRLRGKRPARADRPKTYAKKDQSSATGRRPKLLDAKVVSALEKHLKEGMSIKTACALAGMHECTFHRYIAEAETAEPGSPLDTFCKRMKEAEEFALRRAIVMIQKAGEKNWQAFAWFAERRDPENWGRKERHTHRVGGDPEGVPFQSVTTGNVGSKDKPLSDRELRATLGAALRRAEELDAEKDEEKEAA